MKKWNVIPLAVAVAAMVSGCCAAGGNEKENANSRLAGKWVVAYEQDGKELDLPGNHPPMVKLCPNGKTEVNVRKDGRVKTLHGSWTVENGELVIHSGDGTLTMRFRLVSDSEAYSAVPQTEYIKANTRMVIRKK